jgi:hypothetical protein
MATATAHPPTRRVEGWYRDPKTELGERYWDGDEWTDHLAPPGLMLKLSCVLAAIAAVGLSTAAVWALIVDGAHVTMAGRIAAISAGLLFAIVMVGFIVNFYRGKMVKGLTETESSGEGTAK